MFHHASATDSLISTGFRSDPDPWKRLNFPPFLCLQEDAKTMKTKMREKVRPKMGKIDIDYQKLHDAFFKWQMKPKLTIHGDLYYEVARQHPPEAALGSAGVFRAILKARCFNNNDCSMVCVLPSQPLSLALSLCFSRGKSLRPVSRRRSQEICPMSCASLWECPSDQ